MRAMLAKNIYLLKNLYYLNDNKMAFRPIGRFIFIIKHMYREYNSTSVASLKTALDQKLKGHNQKLLLSLVPYNNHLPTPKFPSSPTKRKRALTTLTLDTEMLYGKSSSAGLPWIG